MSAGRCGSGTRFAVRPVRGRRPCTRCSPTWRARGSRARRGRWGSMSRDGRYSPSWRARASVTAGRARPGFTPRTPWTRLPAGYAPFTRLSPASPAVRRRLARGRHLVAGPDHRPQRRGHLQCRLASGQAHRVLRLGLRRARHAGMGPGLRRLQLGAPALPARCRRRGVHRLHGQAPPARPVPAHLWLASHYRTVPRCGPGARHGPRRRHPRPRRLRRPSVQATPPPGHPRRPRPGRHRTGQLPAIARSANRCRPDGYGNLTTVTQRTR